MEGPEAPSLAQDAQAGSRESQFRPVRPVFLADVLAGRDNNLNAIRMLAAIAVMVSHAWPITGAEAAEPLKSQTGQTLGHYSVAIFFGISGLLIARSFDRRRSLLHFVVARVLRLFPALLVALVLTVIAGAFVSELGLSAYVSSPDVWTYVPVNLSLVYMQGPLPGVFESNIYGTVINGSIWTLFYEVACYAGVVALGAMGLLRKPLAMLAVTVAMTAFHFAGPLIGQLGVPMPPGLVIRLEFFALLSFPFMIGTCAYVWRDRIPLSAGNVLLLWLPVPLLAGTSLMASAIVAALVYISLWVGYIPKGRALMYNRLGDYSYGVYIYAFPVQQGLVWLMPGMSPFANIMLALPVTLLLAALSWHIVETRALAMVTPLGDRIARRFDRATHVPGLPR